MRRFEFQDGGSNKFWEVGVEGTQMTVRFGRIGTGGQMQVKQFNDAAAATSEADRLIREKTRKGYAEAAGVIVDAPPQTASPAVPTRSAPPVEKRSARPDATTPPAPPPPADPIRWTDETRKRTHGLRGFWHAPLEVDKGLIIERIDNAETRKWHKAFQYDKVFAPYKERLLATPRGRLYDLDDDPRFEGMRSIAFHLGWQVTLVPYWGRVKGAAFALEAHVWHHFVYFTNFWLRLRSQTDDVYFESHGWRALRNVVAAASDEEYARAVETAARLREEYSDERTRMIRVGIAYAFPDEVAWGLEEASKQLKKRPVDPASVCLLGAVRDVAVLTEFAKRVLKLSPDDRQARDWGDYVPDLLANVGPPAVPVLEMLLEGTKRAGHRTQIADMLCLVETDGVAAYVVKHLHEKHLAKAGAAYLTRQPERFARVMAAMSNPPAAAAGLLAQVRQKSPSTCEGAPAPTAAPEAAPGDIPPILARPPWEGKLKRKPLTVAGLQILPCESAIAWEAGERETVRRRWVTWQKSEEVPEPQRSPQNDAAILADLGGLLKGDWRFKIKSCQWVVGWNGICTAVVALTPAAARKLLAEPFPAIAHSYQLHGSWLPLLADYGLEAAGWLVEVGRRADGFGAADLLRQAAHVVSPNAARMFAPMVTGRKDQRPIARAWVLAHSETAAIGIVHLAVTESGATRTRAETALRWLARQGHRAIIESVADRYGAPTRKAIDEILASDLGFDKMPKMPTFWTPTAWTRPALEAGGALPPDALQILGVLLAVSTLDDPHFGLAEVRAECSRRTLAAFAEDLFNAWLVAGGPAQHVWAFHALAFLGDDESMRKLVTFMHRWPSEGSGGRSRTLTGLDVLATNASDLALLHLQRFAQTARIRAVQTRAQAALEEAAQARGLTLDQLEDRLVPDLGLAPDGSLRLDFGPRAFTVRFDEALIPRLVDEDRQVLAQFPRPLKTDDAALAKAASERWKQLVDAASTVTSAQIFRLEQAMCRQRRWDVDSFRRFLLAHPLVGHLVGRLLWAVFGQTPQYFRVAEDRTLVDASDRPFTLPADAVVGIPHALELSDEDARTWGQVFADYAILQPFSQIGRDTYTMSPADVGQTVWRQEEMETRASRIRGLANRGWRMEVDATWVHTCEKRLPEGPALTLAFEPGWDVNSAGEGAQKVKGIHSSVPLGDLTPTAYSEMVRDYQWLAT